MKRYFILLFLFSSISLYSQPSFQGDGTENSPYEIWTIDHLIEINNINPSDKHFKLMADITDTVRLTIQFVGGYLHCDGKKITLSLMCDHLTNSCICPALFIGGGNIDGLIVNGYVNYLCGVSGISNTSGIVTNCINNATGMYSGIAYTNLGTISYCINNGSITGVDRMGGIAGDNSGTITNCINTGKITATNSGENSIFSGVGGIVGTVANGCIGISNSINLGNIEGQGFVGGVVGLVRGGNGTPITHCLNAGYVKGINAVGGILGHNFSGAGVSNCINTGVVEGEQDVGSIVGKEN